MGDDASTAVSAAEGYLAFLSSYRHGDDGPGDPKVLAAGPEAERLFRALKGQSQELRTKVITTLAAGMVTLPDPLAAGLVAAQIGGLVERGADPIPLADALRTRLPGDLAAARRFVELVEAETGVEAPKDTEPDVLAQLGRKEPMGSSAWASLQYSTPAAMTVWCRHRPSRLAAKAAPGLASDAKFLGERGGYCWYIGELLAAADGMQLTVLAPEQRKGFAVELEVVRNAAHLFALLEDTLVGNPAQGLLTGPRTDPKIAAIARGEAEMTEAMFFNVGWHYEYWYAFRPEAVAQKLGLHPLVAAMIGVEAEVEEIPEFRGAPLILMRPGVFSSRSCDVNFFSPLHEALRSRVVILRKLSLEEVDSLCGDLGADAEKLR